MTREQVFAAAMALAPSERETLVEELLSTLDPAERKAIDTAWPTEARDRDAAYSRGEVKASPVDDVIKRVLARARQ
jgi:putative addiction module component (TIGR02574 family)